MSTINDRFELFFNSLKMKKLQFDNQIGMARGMTGKILTGTSLSAETTSKIFSLYPNLNANWLFKGEGPMYLNTDESNSIVPLETPSVYGFKMPTVLTVDQSGRENIVMVSSRAFAGYATNIQEPEFLKKFPAFSLPLPEFRNATFRAFQASGRSMDPTIKNGDWLIGEFTDNWPNNIKDGRIYIVVTNDSILVKRLLNRINEGKIVIQSDNMDFPTDILLPEEVQEIWYLKANISQQFPNARYEVASKISNLEADVEILKRQIAHLEKASKANL